MKSKKPPKYCRVSFNGEKTWFWAKVKVKFLDTKAWNASPSKVMVKGKMIDADLLFEVTRTMSCRHYQRNMILPKGKL